MHLSSYFTDFISNIRLTSNQVDDYKKGHQLLRERLENDEMVKSCYVSTFLQGSYKRGTAIKPRKDQRSDVDVVLVTKLSKDEYSPREIYTLFEPFLEKYYKDKYEIQGRSIGISLSKVDLDLVVAVSPADSEIGVLQSDSLTSDDTLEDVDDWRLNEFWRGLANRGAQKVQQLLTKAIEQEEWKSSPLYIPDRDAQQWKPTHPIAQIQWTRDKNRATNGNYINIVRAIKWWHRISNRLPQHPKGYLIEHLVGLCCPDNIDYVAEGIVGALTNIADIYSEDARLGRVPIIPDHGVPDQNVFQRVSGSEFRKFHAEICSAAEIAREALESNDTVESAVNWRKLFGDEFPPPPADVSDKGRGPDKGGFTKREDRTVFGTEKRRFA